MPGHWSHLLLLFLVIWTGAGLKVEHSGFESARGCDAGVTDDDLIHCATTPARNVYVLNAYRSLSMLNPTALLHEETVTYMGTDSV